MRENQCPPVVISCIVLASLIMGLWCGVMFSPREPQGLQDVASGKVWVEFNSQGEPSWVKKK